MGELNAAGGTQQHHDVGRGLELGGQHAHIGQHDAQGGKDAGRLAIAGLHDLGHGDLVGFADLAGDEVEQNNADGGRGKGNGAYPGAAGIHNARGTGDTAAAAPGGQQTAYQNDKRNPVSSGYHVIGSFYFFACDDQAVNDQCQQIDTDGNNVSHIISSSNRIAKILAKYGTYVKILVQ